MDLRVEADGYRTLGTKNEGVPKVVSRKRKDLSARFSDVAVARARLPEEIVIDGDVVALDETGRPSFGALQNGSRGTMLQFFGFDLLFIAGRNVQKRSLEERRQLLRRQVIPKIVNRCAAASH